MARKKLKKRRERFKITEIVNLTSAVALVYRTIAKRKDQKKKFFAIIFPLYE